LRKTASTSAEPLPSRRITDDQARRRFTTTDEVASMVTYLCSEAASATTGSSVRVDGGVVRSIV
jgi:enoyl-[acyl-carrier-protein] reductase (NADH)